MSLGAQVVRGGLVTGGAQAARLALHFGSTIVLSRLVEPSGFGLLAMVLAVVGISEVLRDLGLSTATIQAASLDRQQKTNLFWCNALAGAVCAGATFALAGPVGALYGDPRLEAIAQWLSLVFLLNGLVTQYRAQLARDLRFAALAVVDTVPLLLGVVAAVVAAVSGADYWALVVQQLTTAAGGLLLAVLLCRWLPGLPGSWRATRPLLTFGFSVSGTQLVGYASRNADTLLVGLVAGAHAAGGYNRAFQLLLVPINQLLAPLTRVMVPVLSKSRRDSGDFAHHLRRSQQVTSYATTLAYGLAAGMAAPLVELLLGRRWLFASTLFLLLAISGCFRALAIVIYWGYTSSGAGRALFTNYLSFQPIVVLGALAGVPWAEEGIATGVAAGAAVCWLLSMRRMERDLGLVGSGLLAHGVRVVLAFGLPVGVAAWLGSHWVGSAFLAVLAGTAAAALALAVLLLVDRRLRRDLGEIVAFARRQRGGRGAVLPTPAQPLDDVLAAGTPETKVAR